MLLVFINYGIWMVEGLISPSKKGEDEAMMDVASEFLHELIFRRNTIAISKRNTK